ncbi:MAG: hypothetical protein R3F19_31735 [Verrucomicrobiales bacterium]|nr:hypothetical protein [Verrucomicrobiae bacterium]
MIPHKAAAITTLVALGLTVCQATAGPVKKQPFQADEVSELNQAQIASSDELEDVDAGIFGLLNNLLGLGLTAAAAYLLWKQIEDK